MKWSKLKSLVEAKICSSLKTRVSIYSTAYGNCSCGHAWLTFDKIIIANFCTRAFWNRVNGSYYMYNHRWTTNNPVPHYVPLTQRKIYGAMEYGELSRQNAYLSCWEYVHHLGIEEALESSDPLIQSLAIIDSRVGKRRLEKLQDKNLHPLAVKLLNIRSSLQVNN
jgi:hypothetical protein